MSSIKLDWNTYSGVIDWLQANAGRKFKLYDDGQRLIEKGREVEVATKDPERLKVYLMFYERNRPKSPGYPEVTFNEDFTQFKIIKW